MTKSNFQLSDGDLRNVMALFGTLQRLLRLTRFSTENSCGEYGEWICEKVLGLKKTATNTRGCDLYGEDDAGRTIRYQIKARRITPENPYTQISVVKNCDFEKLIAVYFDPFYNVDAAYALDFNQIPGDADWKKIDLKKMLNWGARDISSQFSSFKAGSSFSYDLLEDARSLIAAKLIHASDKDINATDLTIRASGEFPLPGSVDGRYYCCADKADNIRCLAVFDEDMLLQDETYAGADLLPGVVSWTDQVGAWAFASVWRVTSALRGVVELIEPGVKKRKSRADQ